MKKFVKTMLGVTLLEIMLVLAIAAMIIVMSIRYYQSASSGQQANAVLEQVQAIVAAADSLAQATGAYDDAAVSGTSIKPLLPGGSMTTPWGSDIAIGDVASSSYSIDLGNVPSGVCPLLKSKLATNNHFSSSTTAGAALPTCSTTAATAFKVYYIANP